MNPHYYKVKKIVTAGRIQKKASQRSEPTHKFPKPSQQTRPLMQEQTLENLGQTASRFTTLHYEIDELATAR